MERVITFVHIMIQDERGDAEAASDDDATAWRRACFFRYLDVRLEQSLA